MNDNQISLAEFVRRYDRGFYAKDDLDTMVAAGWYDWFCGDKSLKGRLNKMIGTVRIIATECPFIDPEKVYVFFKNNCPLSGDLYDSFSICDMESGDVQYWVTLRYGHHIKDEYGKAQVVKRPDYGKPILVGNARDVQSYFKTMVVPKNAIPSKEEA